MKKLLPLIILLISTTVFSQIKTGTYDIYTLPKVTQIVNDFENILSDKEEMALHDMLYDYDLKTTNQIVVVTVASIAPFETLYDFSLTLAQRTGAGTAEKDNGIMIVVSKTLRQIQIQNGDGIVAKLTNDETKKIIDDTIIPEFKQNRYFEALQKGIVAIEQELE